MSFYSILLLYILKCLSHYHQISWNIINGSHVRRKSVAHNNNNYIITQEYSKTDDNEIRAYPSNSMRQKGLSTAWWAMQ